jgi:hypothetical protein
MNTESTPALPRIELGYVGFRLPGVDSIMFGSAERALEWGHQHGTTREPVEVDTRPTVGEVLDLLKQAEGRPAKHGIGGSLVVDPWDEYFTIAPGAPSKWPLNRWVSVYVVTGGSEGTYLHVDAIDRDGTRQTLILGKTCAGGQATWMRCYESAARIAWRLGA